jgi:hypothetical protein
MEQKPAKLQSPRLFYSYRPYCGTTLQLDFYFKIIFPTKLTALLRINLHTGVGHYKLTYRLRCSMDETRFSLRMKGTLFTSGAVQLTGVADSC